MLKTFEKPLERPAKKAPCYNLPDLSPGPYFTIALKSHLFSSARLFPFFQKGNIDHAAEKSDRIGSILL